MDLQSLKIFIEAAELRSFTRAGEKLGYSQPTVSFQIKQLEKELGVQLFDRIGHAVSLTDAGKDALSYAQSICQLSQEMTMGVGRREEITGVVRLGMADSLCSPLIVKGFTRFRKAHPKVVLHVITAGTGDLFRLLDHNEVDMVCTLDSHIYNTAYVIAGEEKVGVHFVASARNALATQKHVRVAQLLSQPFLLTERGMSYRRLLDEALARRSMELQPVLEMGSADLISRLVEEDMGLSVLPDYVTEQAVKEGKIVRLAVEGISLELWKQILYRRDKWVPPQMRAMLEHLAGVLLQTGE